MPDAFPLAWPDNFPRTKARESGRFKTTLSSALDNVRESLRLFGADSGRSVSSVVLSSNVTLGQNRPDDPGVAAWFLWDGEQRCIPVDRYQTVEANLQAIHHILEARRVELRHGTLALVQATFKGFTPALSPPGHDRNWRDVMGLTGRRVTASEVLSRWKSLSKERHPDTAGGSHAAMAELNRARDEALKEIGS